MAIRELKRMCDLEIRKHDCEKLGFHPQEDYCEKCIQEKHFKILKHELARWVHALRSKDQNHDNELTRWIKDVFHITEHDIKQSQTEFKIMEIYEGGEVV